MLHNRLFTIPRVAFIVERTTEIQMTYVVHEEKKNKQTMEEKAAS